MVTALLAGRRRRDLLAGLAPDLPWYALYPPWLLNRRGLGPALHSGEWPMPPGWIREAHYASHSLLLLGLLWGAWRLCGREARWARPWLLHLLIDIPTHSRERLAPRPFWPLSRWAYDGFSWADWLARRLAAIAPAERPITETSHYGGKI